MEVERDSQTATLGDAGASNNSSNGSSGISDGSNTSTSATTADSSTSDSLSLIVSKNRRTAMGKGRWTSQEHADFLIGLEKYGKDWKAIADVVKTRTTVQTRTHHQKYDKQVKKGRKFPEEPYEDDDDDGGGSGRSGRKPPRTKAIRPSRAGILISRTPVTVRGKRLLTPPGGSNGNGGGGSRGRPRSTRAASAAAAKAKAEADAAKDMAEATAARAVEAEARAADAAAAAAEAAAMSRVREEDAFEGSSDTGQTAGKEYRPEKRVKTDHLSADCDAAAAGTSSAYGRQRFSFPSAVTAPGTATPPTVAEVPPSPRKEATFTKSLWSSFGNLAAQGQPAASGEVGMEGEVGSYVGDRELSGGASAMPVKAITEASAGVGSGFTSCQLSPFLCETFLDGFVVGGEDAEDLPEAPAPAPAAAPAFSMAASSSPPTFAGGHKVETERSGRDKQGGDDGMHLARPGSSFSSAAAVTAAGYNAQQLLHQQQQQQQQRLQQAQQLHQQQQQRRVLLSSGSAAVAAFGSLPDSTATLYPGAPFDPTATGIPIPGIGGLESFSPGGYAAGFGSMSEGNGVVGVGGGILNPFSAASTSPVFFRRSDFGGGGGGVLDDKLEFPGGVGMAGVVGEGVVGSLKHNEQAFGLDKRLAAFRQQQQQRMLGQVFHFRPNSAPAAATATSMLSSSSSSFGDADAAHKLRRAAAAISPGAFDINVDGDGSSISTSTSGTSKGHKQDNVATSSVFGMSSDNGSSSGGKTLSSDGLTDELAGYGSEGWPDDGMENLEQFDVLAVFAFDDHFGIL